MSNVPSLPHPVAHMLIADGSDDVYTSDQMREYGRACERAAYERAAEACLAQRNPPPVLIADRVRYDPANAMAERCAAVVSLLGADK